MKRLWNIYEKIRDMDNLIRAHQEASRGKGYYKRVQIVNKNPKYYLQKIQDMLKDWTYHLSEKDYHVSKIRDKTKERELRKLDYYPHRIIQRAIALQICDSFLSNYCYHTCASIKDRGNERIQKLMYKYLKELRKGGKPIYCLKIDIHHFYQSINHKILKSLLRKKFKDSKLISLLDNIIDSYPWKVWIPIGSYLSQYLANFYLSYFDHYCKEVLRTKYIARYMDDIVILSNSKNELQIDLRYIKKYLHYHLLLELKGNYQIFNISKRGIDFVWYVYYPYYTLLRKRIKNSIKRITKVINGEDKINGHEYCGINSYRWWIKHCNGRRLYNHFITPIADKVFRYWRYEIVERKVTKRRCKKYYTKFIHWLDKNK